MLPQGPPPREETRLEFIAARAGVEADWLRDYLAWEIAVLQEEAEAAWRAELWAAAGFEPVEA